MVMIEKKVGSIAVAEEVKQIPVNEKKELSSGYPGRRKVNGCLFIIAFFLFVICGLAWIVAASGFVKIPIVSNLAYKTPNPLRVVLNSSPLETYISETFGNVLTNRLQSGSGSLENKDIELFLSESSITTFLQTIIIDNNLSFFSSDTAQVAIDEKQGIEIFLPLAGQVNRNALIILAKIKAENGLIVTDEVKLKVGNLSIPYFLTDIFLKPALNKGLDYLNQKIGRYASVKTIEVSEGFLKVFGTLKVEIMKIQ